MDKFRFSTFCFQYVTYIIQLVLSLIPEPEAKGALQDNAEVRGICFSENSRLIQLVFSMCFKKGLNQVSYIAIDFHLPY